jgi:ribA/ribD-fused uncharacterized protein
MEKIEQFSEDFRFLSNFYPSAIVYEGMAYASVEHAYQAAKTRKLGDKAYVAAARTPGEAKQRGRQVPIRKDWDEIKLGVMEELLRLKFYSGGPLAARLCYTGNAELIEGNHWSDTFWGVCEGKGRNHLGKLLMARRRELVGKP